MLRNWFKRLSCPKQSFAATKALRNAERAKFSLRLEQLEDRLAPALFAVTADLQVLPLAAVSAQPAAQVVFIESSVPQAAQLLAGLAPQTDGVLLDAQGDGLREMAVFLAGRSGLTAIDVVAHGQSGAVNLGALTLDEATLSSARPELGILAAALSGQGSLDLWSCDVAAGDGGRGFVKELGTAVGGRVAAASHLVGAAALGGSWQLDVSIGKATATNPFTAAAQQEFAAVLDTWSNITSLNTARAYATATLLNNGQVLVAGGVDINGNLLSSAELYDPTTNTWSTTGSLNAARENATATLLNNGQVLVAGGDGNNDGPLSSAELYDPTTNTWSTTGSLHTARDQATATLLNNGQILVAGGYNNGYLSSAELYDPTTNTWSTTGSLHAARYLATATLLNNGQVLVAGGYGNGEPGYLSSAELYDPTTNTWSTTGSLHAARYLATATLLNNGQVLVAGGYGTNGPLSSAELYDPTTNTWSTTGSLHAARAYATATLLNNGQILVAGGIDNNGLSSSAELYDPTTNTWSTTGSLHAARYEATATLLNNGQVLVAGGYGTNGTLSSAELYGVITTSDASFTYGMSASTTVVAWSGTPPASTTFTATNLPTWATLDPTTGVLSGTPTAAGTQIINVTASDGSTNYYGSFTLTVAQAPLTITAEDKSRYYGAADPAFTATYSGLVNHDSPADLGGSLSFYPQDYQDAPPSTYEIDLGGLTSANYAITFIPGTLTVNAAPLTITAENQTKIYGQANPTLTVSYSGFVLGEGPANLAGVLSIATLAATSSPVGPYTITPSGLTSSDYAVTFVNGNLTVTPAPLTILVADRSKMYGQANPVFSSNYLGFVNGDTASSLTGTLALATTATAGSAAGTYAISASGVSSSNYTITVFAGTLTVTPAPLFVSADAKFKVYGQANPTLTATYSGFVNGDTAVNLTGALALGASATSSSGAGVYAIAPSGVSSSNYTITFLSGMLFVMPAPLTVTADDQTKVFGQSNPAFTASYNGLVNGDTSASLGGALAFTTPAIAASPVGAYPITPGGLASPNYSIFFVNGRLTVTNTSQTISFTPLVNPVALGVQPITLSAAASSGLPVSFQVVSGPGSINGNVLTVTGAGNIVVEADQPGDAQHSAAAPVQQTLVALKATDAITFGPLPAIPLGKGPVTLTAGGGGSSNPVTYTVLIGPATISGNQLTATGLGAVLVEATQAGDANYRTAIPVFQTFRVETAQTITFTQPASPAPFTPTPITLSAAASSALPIAFSVVSGPATVSGNKLSITGIGSIVIEADQAGNATFAAAPPVQRILVIAKANQTITFNALTAVSFGAAPITLGATASSKLPIAYRVVSGPGTINGSQLTITGVGSIMLAADQAGNSNYNAAVSVQRTLVVNKAGQTITFHPLSAVPYGSAPISLGATASSGLAVVYSVTSGPGTINGNQLTITGAGAIVLKATQAGNSNFNAALAVSQTLTVNKGTLTVTANNATWTAGMPNQQLAGFTITGFVNTDTQASLFATEAASVSCPTVNASNPAANTYVILVRQGTLVTPANYNLVFVTGKLKVQ